jgi:hypothetical protein
MSGGGTGYLILDACVLIDYAEADTSVLEAIAAHVAPIAIARPVLDEVDQLDEDEATNLGLDVVELDLDVALEAGRSGGALSFEDWICLLLAKREGWTCVTNDGPLRKHCKAEGVTVLWGLELMLRAVEADALARPEAVDIARAIHEANPYYVTRQILDAFVRKLRRR